MLPATLHSTVTTVPAHQLGGVSCYWPDNTDLGEEHHYMPSPSNVLTCSLGQGGVLELLPHGEKSLLLPFLTV